MEIIKGTNVAGPITPYSTLDKYPTHYAEYGKGGYRTVNTLTDLNAIPSNRCEEGMLVYVADEKKVYIYHDPRNEGDDCWSESDLWISLEYLNQFKQEIRDEVENINSSFSESIDELENRMDETEKVVSAALIDLNFNITNLDDSVDSRLEEYQRLQEESLLNGLAEVTNSISELQSQLDNEINSWFLSGAPTLKNQPAVDWTTEEEKNRHLGDTYTDISEYISNDENSTSGQSWRFCKLTEGENITYYWHLISDNIASKALYDAAQAQAAADGKCTTYLSKPVNGYRVGDIWILESDEIHPDGKTGDILIADSNNDSYVESDWEKKVNYTDDTLAKEAKVAADKAQEDANKAYDDAQQALNDLKTVHAEGRVYADEIKILLNEYRDILSEKTEILNEASKYDASINTAAYEKAADDALKALDYYASKSNYDEGKDYITIDKEGAPKWEDITNYYTARQVILEEIVNAIKTYSDNIFSSAEEAKGLAESAKKSADEMLTKFNEFTDDGLLTVIEKRTIKAEWERIKTEYKSNDDRVNDETIGLWKGDVEKPQEWLSYQTAYNNLETYINDTLKLYVDVNDTVEIDRELFNNTFNEYYTTNYNLQIAISTRIADLEVIANVEEYVDAAIKDLDLPSLIDGQLSSHFGEGAPTLIDKPAVDWVTDDDKDKHINDTYTDIDEKSDTAGKSWRFTKEGDVYSWELIPADSDIAKALEAAAKAQDTADGKRTTFYGDGTPVPPYSIGDLWVKVDGSLLVCVEPKEDGEEVAEGDFIPTTSELSPEMQKEIEEIKELQETFNTNFSEINSDDYFSISEKKVIRSDWEAISGISDVTLDTSEYEKASGSFGEAIDMTSGYISDTITEYVESLDLAISNLSEDLLKLKFYTAENTKWSEAGEGYTRANLAEKFTIYYNAEIALINEVNRHISAGYTDEKAGEAKTAADNAQQTAQDAQDAANNAKTAADNVQNSLNQINNDEFFSTIEKQIIRTEWELICGDIEFIVDENGDGSFMKACNLAAAVGIGYTGLENAFASLMDDLIALGLYTNEDTKWAAADKSGKGYTRANLAEKFTNYYNAEIALIDQVNQYYAQQAAKTANDFLNAAWNKGTTDIGGGIVMTNVLQLKDMDGNVTAGLSGLEDDNVLLWGGGDYATAHDAANNNGEITTILKKDGTGKIGIFNIDNDTVKVINNNQQIYITHKSIEDVSSLQKSYNRSGVITDCEVKGRDGEIVAKGSDDNYTWTTLTDIYLGEVNGGNYKLSGIINVTDQSIQGNIVGLNGASESQKHEDYKGYVKSRIEELRFRIKQTTYGGEQVADKVLSRIYSRTLEKYFWYDNQSSDITDTGLTEGNFSDGVDIYIKDKANVRIYVEAIYYVRAEMPAGYEGSASAGIDFNYSLNLFGADKYTVIANDGIAVISNANSQFYIKNDSEDLNVIMNGLPSYPANTSPNNINLTKGQIYSLDGVLRVK